MSNELPRNPCCARCTKPIQGTPVKIGFYTYGQCCLDENGKLKPKKRAE